MPLVRMALTNYRCFAQSQDIELRPITLILGRNNSGKSAIVRAPVVCNTGMRTDSPAPLDLDLLSEDFLESFTDLIYGNRPHGSIGIELEFGDQRESSHLAATVQHIDEYQTQVVSSLVLQTGQYAVSLTWEPRDPPEDMRYSIESGNQLVTGVPVVFQGLLPTDLPDPQVDRDLGSLITTAAREIRESYPAVRYFGPFRDRPQRRYKLPARMPTQMGISGEHAASMLASDVARQQGRLVRKLNEVLGKDLPGWSIEVAERGGMYAVMLTSEDDNTISVNLADVGTGVAQMLPIFVQRALDLLSPPKKPVLEIIEQPELHLHPAAHGALADLYLNAAKRGGVRFIIETHSETLLLRLRRRIAEGQVDPRSVAIYFVEHHSGGAEARLIRVSADGSLDYWPAGVFSEDYDETRALASAQLARGDAGAS